MHALATKMFKINAIFSPEIVSEIFMRDIIHYSFDKGDIVSFSENIPRATKKEHKHLPKFHLLGMLNHTQLHI